MNPTGIEWTDFTWNPVTGCLRGCHYCYAKGIARRFGKTDKARAFLPEFHPDRLDEPGKRRKPAKIFVGSMCDLFGHWVPDEWIYETIHVARQNPRHTFQFLTKYPARLSRFMWPDNCWVGTTVTDQQEMYGSGLAMSEVTASVRFVSVEPMLGPVPIEPIWRPDWVIIGALTGRTAPGLTPRWANALTREYDTLGIPVFHKPSLGPGFTRREWPT